jgi:uncharacterized protein YfiM (DUF2279 family)
MGLMTRRLVPVAVLCLVVATPARSADGDEWLSRDKAIHAAAGAGLGAGGYFGGALVTESPGRRAAAGMAVALTAGALKEWHDRGRGTASVRDFVWDGVGAAAGVTVAWLVDRAMRRGPAHAPTSRVTPGDDGRPRVVASPAEGYVVNGRHAARRCEFELEESAC